MKRRWLALWLVVLLMLCLFAANYAVEILSRYQHGVWQEQSKQYSGALRYGMLIEENTGEIVVLGVDEHSDAQWCGIYAGDVIVKVDGSAPESAKWFDDRLDGLLPDAKMLINLNRDGESKALELKRIEHGRQNSGG